MEYTIAIENSSIQPEAEALFEQDWLETIVFNKKLKIDYDYYKELEKQGRLLIITARHESNLIGYIIFIVSQSMHTGKLAANSSGWFVGKKYRGQGVGRQLIKSAKILLKSMQLTHMRVSVSPMNDVAHILENEGGKKEETIFGWEL